MQENVKDILKQNRLSVTGSRVEILELFLAKGNALSHCDIEKNTGESFDRVTVYRTLQTFVEKGIIHTIPTADNSIRYALCKECEEGHHHDEHVHFVCTNCGRTICLDDVVSPKIELPEGYIAHEVQVVINGICIDCNHD